MSIQQDVVITNAVLTQSPATNRPCIVLVTPWHPEPADNGSKQRLRGLIQSLGPAYDIVLVSLVEASVLAEGPLPKVSGVVEQFALRMPGYHSHSLTAVLGAARFIPRSFAATWDRRTMWALRSIVNRFQPEVVIGTDLRVIRYVSSLGRDVRVILDEAMVSPFIDVHTRASSLNARVRGQVRRWKYRRLLATCVPSLDTLIVPSRIEASALHLLCPTANVLTIENGVTELPRVPWQVTPSHQLLYTGALTYSVNAEAISAFARDIMPLLAEHDDRVCLAVTGVVPRQVPEAARHPRIHLTGRLDSLDDIYHESRVFVAPIISGTGTRIKLLEAMAYGLPIVSTSKGAEGLDIRDGEHMLLADTPEDFARAVTWLMNDPVESERLGRNARALIERRYLWTDLGTRLRALVDDPHGRQPCRIPTRNTLMSRIDETRPVHTSTGG